jgi:serine/threonine protein kinase
MLYGNVPFKANKIDELHQLIIKGEYTLGEGISNEAQDLLTHILELDPHKRFTIPEILAHEWFEDYDDSGICLI